MVVGPALGNESVNQTNQVLVDLVSGKYPGKFIHLTLFIYLFISYNSLSSILFYFIYYISRSLKSWMVFCRC